MTEEGGMTNRVTGYWTSWRGRGKGCCSGVMAVFDPLSRLSLRSSYTYKAFFMLYGLNEEVCDE